MSGSRRRRRPGGAVNGTLRMTYQVQVVLAALLKDPAVELYGWEIATRTGLLPDTAYPILGRLRDRGWVSERREDVDTSQEQRPQRCYYRLTSLGVAKAQAALSKPGIPQPGVPQPPNPPCPPSQRAKRDQWQAACNELLDHVINALRDSNRHGDQTVLTFIWNDIMSREPAQQHLLLILALRRLAVLPDVADPELPDIDD